MRTDCHDKLRLYAVAYNSSSVAGAALKDPIIHWALMLGPKHEDPLSLRQTNVIYHVTNTRTGRWEYERRPAECVRSPSMLGRISLGKVDPRHIADVEKVLEDKSRMWPGEQGWDCWTWVKDAIQALTQHAILHVPCPVDPGHLRLYGEAFSAEVIRRKLDRGFDIPVTVCYPGAGPIPRKILK